MLSNMKNWNRPFRKQKKKMIINYQHLEKYQSVYEVNNNFVGWVYIPDTPLNYPVLQTKDYPEYYLRRDFYKKYSFAGVPFMDFKCTADESDNIILYSHNMLDGTMFSVVEKYSKKSFWEEHLLHWL